MELDLLKDQICVKGKHPWICYGISGMKRNENDKKMPGLAEVVCVMAPGIAGTQRGISTRMKVCLAQSWKRGHRTKPNDNRMFPVRRLLKCVH